MTTRREDIRDEIEDAFEDIDTTHTYDRAASLTYNITITEVEYLVQGPDQVDNVDRPYIGFKEAGPARIEYFPGHQMRVTIPWRAYFYPDLLLNGATLYTQTNGALEDMRHALHKSARVEGDLRSCITLLNITGEDTTEGSLTGERGFVSMDFETVHWEKTDA